MNTTLVLILIGLTLLNLVAVWVALARRTQTAPPPPPPTPEPNHHSAATPPLSAAQLQRLEEQTQQAFQKAVERATSKFSHDLDGTSERLNHLIVKLTTDVVETELVEYRKRLEAARSQALTSLAQMQTAVDAEQSKLQEDMQAEIDKHKARLIERIDNKLGEAVAAYLVESLGQGADLGAQREAILASLERNKAALKRELSDGL